VSSGRLAATSYALPTIHPVAIEMQGDDLNLTPFLGSLAPIRPNQVVALEAGNLDEVAGGGWTVVVRGMLVVDCADSELACPDITASQFRLSTELVSGWRSSPSSHLARTQNRSGQSATLTRIC